MFWVSEKRTTLDYVCYMEDSDLCHTVKGQQQRGVTAVQLCVVQGLITAWYDAQTVNY